MGAVTSVFSEALAFDDGRVLVFAGRPGFRRSNNAGKVWQRAMDGYTSSNGVEPYGNGFFQAPSAPSTIYSPGLVFGPLLTETPVFRSDNLGRTWRSMGTIPFGEFALASDCAVDATNPEGLLKSLDGGQTVVSLGVFGDFSMLAIDPRDSQTVYAGNSAGGVLRSTDGGATWRDASHGLPSGATLAVAPDPRIAGRLYAWVQAGGLFVSEDRGGNWMATDTSESVRRSGIHVGQAAIAVDRVVSGRVYLGNSGVLLFPDDGKRHELIDGEHFVAPTPNRKHQAIAMNLGGMIWGYLQAHPIGRVFAAPLEGTSS